MVEIALQSFRPNGLRMAPIKTSLAEHLAEDQVTNAGKMVVTTPRKPRSPVIQRAALGYDVIFSEPVDAHSARFPIRATIVPALDHEERRESLSVKMPRLPSSVGGALFLCL